jgi:intracellular septation protein
VSKSSCPHLAQAGYAWACSLPMGALNLYVAFNFSREIWLSFKLFGSLGLMLVFVMAQSLFLSKYIEEKK